jgi:DNA-directed RNA polymerase I subunit RPA49
MICASGKDEDMTSFYPVSYPALEPSNSTPFKCYLRKKPGDEEDTGQEFVAQSTFVAGEAESVEFFSSDETQRASVGSRCVRKN